MYLAKDIKLPQQASEHVIFVKQIPQTSVVILIGQLCVNCQRYHPGISLMTAGELYNYP